MKPWDDWEDEEQESKTGNLVDFRLLIPVAVALVLMVVILVSVFVMEKNTKNEKVQEVSEIVEEPVVEPLIDGMETTGQSVEKMEKETLEEKDVTEQPTEEESDEEEPGQTEDPQQSSGSMGNGQGSDTDVAKILSSDAVAETSQITMGIDVSRYQGTIDWAKVAESGINFAMVRVGYRTNDSRKICVDTNARYNMQEAQKNGIKVGVYFFSTAASIEEAVAEADWVADFISQYQITYPVAYDCEGFEKPESAQYELTNAERTDIAIAFLQEIYNRGYTPIFYASMGELEGNAKWDTGRIESICKIWVSQYPQTPYPQTARSAYTGTHAMWQYTNRGIISGIDKPVDVNIAYFGYEGTATAQNEETPEEAQADVEALMDFTSVDEVVTAKDSTNLRDIPSQGEESTVVYTLQNGESVTRTGVSNSGWSRISYNGQTLYAVSSFLTTDLSYHTPEPEGTGSGDGLKTKFVDRNEQVTAKIEVNLRTLPSVTNSDATVVAVLHNGEYVTRTGINEEYGWSRVEYNGQTLYCISSYLTQ
ncbi:MAG: GH25 family lysozyme [Lachnospiraceae bacterium]|nr:GH25 family lysozyme [Lachnospiraceae bacterium]